MSAKRSPYSFLPVPFEHIRIDVTPMRRLGQLDDLTVGIMNTLSNQGRRADVSLAEAEAKAVLKAIRAYRRAHPEVSA